MGWQELESSPKQASGGVFNKGDFTKMQEGVENPAAVVQRALTSSRPEKAAGSDLARAVGEGHPHRSCGFSQQGTATVMSSRPGSRYLNLTLPQPPISRPCSLLAEASKNPGVTGASECSPHGSASGCRTRRRAWRMDHQGQIEYSTDSGCPES